MRAARTVTLLLAVRAAACCYVTCAVAVFAGICSYSQLMGSGCVFFCVCMSRLGSGGFPDLGVHSGLGIMLAGLTTFPFIFDSVV